MPTYALICFGVAVVLAIVAILYQRWDLVPDYGNTVGGDLVINNLWLIASLSCAAGSLAFVPWIVSLVIAIGVYGLSWWVRRLIEKTSLPTD
ncbi:MAG: hypothetical protein KDA84_07285 [Planctomycetaceae bacterium]|nr:hypothetical protein [Planctomycetaceae bacterium]